LAVKTSGNAMIRVMSHREPALLITGRTISAFGDGIANVALALIVLHVTNNNALALGTFAAARMIPFVLLLLVGGVTADRLSRRTILLVSDVGRFLVATAIVVLIALGTLHFWELLVMAVIFGAFDAVFFPAMTALTPEIVPGDLLNAWNALRPLANQLAGAIIGPAVGGLLVSLSYSLALGIDAATFLVSAICIAAMHPTPARGSTEGSSMLAEIGEGLNFTRRTTWIWATLLAAGLSNALLGVPVISLAPQFLRQTLSATPAQVGLVIAAGGVAGAIGTIVVGSRPIPRRRIRVMFASWIFSSLVLMLFGLSGSVLVAAVIIAVSSPGFIFGNVIWESLLQAEVPGELLGRVSSVDWLVSLGLTPIGLFVAGALVGAFGMRDYAIGAGIVCVVPAVIAMLSKRVNAVDDGRLESAPS
jgi:MFS family permease